MNKIIPILCLALLLDPFPVQAQSSQISKWAYNAADKLIKSGLIADKNITVDELANFLISSDTSPSDTSDISLGEQTRIEKIAQILATEKNLVIKNNNTIVSSKNSKNTSGNIPTYDNTVKSAANPEINSTVTTDDTPAITKKNFNNQPVSTINKSSSSIPPLLQRFNEPAPEWVYEPLERMNKAGLLSPDDATILSNHDLNRREAAILTARAYNLNKQNNIINVPAYLHSDSYDNNIDTQIISADIQSLMQEFSIEIQALGYESGKDAFTKKTKEPFDNSLKIKGEIRYNIMSNSSTSPKYNWDDHRIRTRIYLDKPIDSNWTVHGMLESDKSLTSSNENSSYYTEDKDGKISLDRYYITGKTYLFNLPVNVDAGKTSAYLAEGNILDSDFKGIKLSTFGPDQGNKSTLYSLGYGKVDDTQNTFYLEAHHTTNNDIDYLAGLYHWNNYGTPTSIYTLGTDYYIGNYTLGAMYLKASEQDKSNSSDGYVLTAKYGYNRSWISGTYEIDTHYYDMAGTTYINHTMSGLGSYMNGFKGYSAGWYYTLTKNILLGIEYYDLKDKTSLDNVKTWWGQVSYSF
jgi:hypothetical protein